MSCYNINLKQLKNCGLSLNDKRKYKTKSYSCMGGPFDIVDVNIDDNGISLWNMLENVCYDYSEKNAWDRTINLSCRSVFKNIKNNLLTKSYYESIKDKIKIENKITDYESE
jgi:hypothetical protein